jgi:lipoprotein-releasing system ATP-binding protein
MMQSPPAAAPQASRATREGESRASGTQQNSTPPVQESSSKPITEKPVLLGKKQVPVGEKPARLGDATLGDSPLGNAPLIRVEGLRKSYRTARGELTLFEGLDLEVQAGEMVAIVGQSGAGKSTLLHILGALDAPTAGTVYFASTQAAQVNVASLSPREAAAFRNREIGYVWQFHYLLPEFTAEENVAMPLMARGMGQSEARKKAANWLREVDLEDRAAHRPGELSGGEQQRVALARALVCSPRLLLADEPTGDLDGTTAGRVFEFIERLHASHGLTSILVTHNLELAERCTRILRLANGRLTALTDAANPAS